MATRQDTSLRKKALERHLRELCEQKVNTGGSLPALRDLCGPFELSLTAAHGILQTLQREGLITSNRGSGTIVIPRQFNSDILYVRIKPFDAETPHVNAADDAASSGFSGRIAELGAFVIELPTMDHLARLNTGSPTVCRGAFLASWDPDHQQSLIPSVPFPIVGFYDHADPSKDDCITFDDFTGGRSATEHLMALGHQSVHFLGETSSLGPWSAHRADGYRAAMEAASREAHSISLPWQYGKVNSPTIRQFGCQIGLHVIKMGLPEAVIAANDDVALGFLTALHQQGVPLIQWPAIVGFDDSLSYGGQRISSMRVDYRDIGRAAADVLWERSHGILTGPPTVREVPMQLIARLTSQQGWAYRLDRLLGGYPVAQTTD